MVKQTPEDEGVVVAEDVELLAVVVVTGREVLVVVGTTVLVGATVVVEAVLVEETVLVEAMVVGGSCQKCCGGKVGTHSADDGGVVGNSKRTNVGIGGPASSVGRFSDQISQTQHEGELGRSDTANRAISRARAKKRDGSSAISSALVENREVVGALIQNETHSTRGRNAGNRLVDSRTARRFHRQAKHVVDRRHWTRSSAKDLSRHGNGWNRRNWRDSCANSVARQVGKTHQVVSQAVRHTRASNIARVRAAGRQTHRALFHKKARSS